MWAKSTAVWRSVGCDVPPALQWREHHEQIGGSIPLILIVMPRGLSWLHLDRGHTRFGLDRGCFDVSSTQSTGQYFLNRAADDKTSSSIFFHVGYERRIGIRWDDPLSLQVRSERVF